MVGRWWGGVEEDGKEEEVGAGVEEMVREVVEFLRR
jgi:hypothetical protein